MIDDIYEILSEWELEDFSITETEDSNGEPLIIGSIDTGIEPIYIVIEHDRSSIKSSDKYAMHFIDKSQIKYIKNGIEFQPDENSVTGEHGFNINDEKEFWRALYYYAKER